MRADKLLHVRIFFTSADTDMTQRYVKKLVLLF